MPCGFVRPQALHTGQKGSQAVQEPNHHFARRLVHTHLCFCLTHCGPSQQKPSQARCGGQPTPGHSTVSEGQGSPPHPPVAPVVGALGILLIIHIIICHQQVLPLDQVFVIFCHVRADAETIDKMVVNSQALAVQNPQIPKAGQTAVLFTPKMTESQRGYSLFRE